LVLFSTYGICLLTYLLTYRDLVRIYLILKLANAAVKMTLQTGFISFHLGQTYLNLSKYRTQ